MKSVWLRVINSTLANQIAWQEIEELVEEATGRGDPVGKTFKNSNCRPVT